MRIGIAPWGNIYNREKLTNKGKTVFYEKFSSIINSNEKIQEESLENYHSHFFLVDDGYVNKPGGEMVFRGKFERAMHSLNNSTRRGNYCNNNVSDFTTYVIKLNLCFSVNISAITSNLLLFFVKIVVIW